MTVLPVDVMRVNLANVNRVNKISIGVYATCFAKPSCTHSKVVMCSVEFRLSARTLDKSTSVRLLELRRPRIEAESASA
jgi:transcription elongation factor Elf1